MSRQRVITLARVGEDLQEQATATDGSGGFYSAIVSGVGTIIVSRVEDDATITWQTEWTPAAGSPGTPALVCSATRLGLAFVLGTNVCAMLLDAADGTIVWQVEIADMMLLGSTDYPDLNTYVALSSANDLYVSGRHQTTNTLHKLVKLAVADGSLVWACNPTESGGAGEDYSGRIALASSGDLIYARYHSATSISHVFQIDKDDGTLVWSRQVTWTTGAAVNTLIATHSDGSIYLLGSAPTNLGDYSALDLIKLDSSGATVWIKQLEDTPQLKYLDAGGGAGANADGFYFGVGVSDATFNYYHAATLYVNAAGTSGQGVRWTDTVNDFNDGSGGGFGFDPTTGHAYLGFWSLAAGDKYWCVVKTEDLPNTSDPSGAQFDVETFALTCATSTTAISSLTITLETAPSITPTAGGMTDAAATLTSVLFEGDDVGGGGGLAGAAYGFKTTQFGLPRNSYSWAVAGFSGTQFGTALYDINLEPQAASLGPTVRFGTPYAVDYGAPEPRAFYASDFKSTIFGSPTAAVAGLFTQPSTDPSTRFGAALARRRQPAPTLGPTANFGTVGGRLQQRASGFASTAFGTPTGSRAINVAGFSTTQFGTPRAPGALYGRYYDLDGFSTTQFGTASARLRQVAAAIAATAQFGTPSSRMQTRGQGFKTTQFGLAQANFTLQAFGFASGDFGTPRAPGAVLGRGGLPFGFSTTRFGTPRAARSFVGDVSDFSSTVFGTPAVAQRHLARAIRPGTRWGTPYVARTCP